MPQRGPSETRALALVGPGRAGTSVALGLAARGFRVVGVAGRSATASSTRAAADRLGAPALGIETVARGADVVVIATPDAAVPGAAAAIAASVTPSTLVLHLAGSLGVDALDAVPARTAALHPLMTIPAADHGCLHGAFAAVAGDEEVRDLAQLLGMTPFDVPDEYRAAYHAAACIASNHLVALLGQVARVAPVPLEAFLPLVRATVDNVAVLGPERALTGPVARGDAGTVAAHLRALDEPERGPYRALAREASRLAQGPGRAAAPALEELLA